MLTTAAVWRGGARVDLERLSVPVPRDGEVLVRVLLATVCGSDLHTVAGHRASPCPSVLGHEAVGEVVAVGGGTDVVEGDRVVWGVVVPCGQCDRCARGRTAKCRRLRKIGHERFDADWPLSGAFAEHVLLPQGSTIMRVPAGLPDCVAAPAACATATVIAAVEAAGPVLDRAVLVSGAGMLGLSAISALVAAGARDVLVTDLSASRLELARAFGATETLRAGEQLPWVDVAVELSGAGPAIRDAYEALDVGGRLVLAGSASPTAALALDPERVVRSWLTVTGVHNYEPQHLQQALALLSTTSHLPWPDLVSPPRPLDHIGTLLTPEQQLAPRTAVAP